MNAKWFKRLALVILAAAIASGFAWLLWPQPILVDLAHAHRGPMELTITEEGTNRIRDTYIVSAPVTGKVARNPLRVGDKVLAGTTIVASIRPVEPPMLDERTRLELERAVEAAKAARDLAEAEVRRAQASVAFADIALKRAVTLMEKRVLSQAALDKAQLDMDVAIESSATAKAQLDLRQHDLEMAEARLLPPGTGTDQIAAKDCCITLTSPVSGVVLNVIQSSEGTVPAGTALIEIGNLQESEIAVDLLSSDAVGLKPGAKARISGWGGTGDLWAHVREIEPTAFTKVSALGIEEQRVKVLLDHDEEMERRQGLGQNFRVVVHITTWASENAFQVPVSALFRKGDQWAVFAFKDGKAVLTPVKVGAMNGVSAEITEGLPDNQAVIVHPSDQVIDGAKVEARPTNAS